MGPRGIPGGRLANAWEYHKFWGNTLEVCIFLISIKVPIKNFEGGGRVVCYVQANHHFFKDIWIK
jgi:hypothetical protein